MGLVLAVGMLAYLYAHSLEPVYRANATLLMDLGGNRISPVKAPQVGDSYLAYYRSLTYYETQSRLIRSQSLAEKVVEDLELWEHPRFDPNQKVRSAAKYPEIAEWRKNFSISKLMFWREVEEAETEKKEIDVKDLKRSIAKNLAGSIQAKRLDGTDIIELYYHSNDNKLAAAVVNSYAERYIEMGMENQVDQMQKAGFWLTERMADLRRTMRDSENRLQRFLEKNDFMSDKSAGQLVDEQVGKLSDMLFSEEVAYNNQREEVRELRALQGMPVEKISKSLIIMGSETVKGLRSEVAQLQGNVEELATRYGDKHPRMISARKDLEIAVENLDKAISNAIEGATKSLERKKAKIDRLKQQLEEKKQDVQSSNRTEFSLLSLKREVDVNRELYNAFLTKFKQTNASVDLTTTNAKVIDEAEVPYEAIAPNKRKIITIASIITLLLAVGLVVLLEQLDATLKSGEDVENRLGLPTLGTLNLLRKGQLNNKSPAKMILEDSKSSFAESVRSIRTGITLSSLDDPHKVMMVTSTVPGEGKTTLAINLALSFAQMETVLLIDADMRRPSVGKYFEIPKEKPGLSDFVAGHASQEEVIHKTESGLSVMSAGAIPPNPSELLSSKRFAQHIERFSERYDRIIIDSAPVQAVADPIILSRTANIVVYVAKADATPYPLVQAAIKKMRRVNATVVGVVLNQQDANKSSRYRYYGKYGIYSRYGRYYDSYYHHDYY
jgi:capsular exopolysaccharide synthesis family protein